MRPELGPTADEVLHRLLRAGWRETRRRGRHILLRHPSRPGFLVVPAGDRRIKRKTLTAVLHASGAGRA